MPGRMRVGVAHKVSQAASVIASKTRSGTGTPVDRVLPLPWLPGSAKVAAPARLCAASADVPTVIENAVWPFAVAATFEGVTHGPGNASVLVQVSVELPVNPPIEVRSSEYVAVVPAETVIVVPPLTAGPNSKSAAEPVSFTLVCAFVAEFEAITSVPLREGDCVVVPGSNATDIVHVEPATTGLPHPFVT